MNTNSALWNQDKAHFLEWVFNSRILSNIKSWLERLLMNRDDFSDKVKEQLARRASYICSNPDCRRNTLIPEVSNNAKAKYVGIAAHITAAAKGGPRYDSSLTSEQRSSIENGIHLCSFCATLIDANVGDDYDAALLREWKILHESWLHEQQKNNSILRKVYYNRLDFYGIETDFIEEERASGYIISPIEDSSNSSRFVSVTGRIDKVVQGSAYWIAVSPQISFDKWWVQNKCDLIKENFWTVENVALGRKYPDGVKDIGRIFEIGLFEVTEDTIDDFINSMNQDKGIERPHGAYLLWKTRVKRTA